MMGIVIFPGGRKTCIILVGCIFFRRSWFTKLLLAEMGSVKIYLSDGESRFLLVDCLLKGQLPHS